MDANTAFCIVSIISTAVSMILFLAMEKRPKLITVWLALSGACLCLSFGIALHDDPGFIVGVVGFAFAGVLVWLVTKFGKTPTPAELEADRTPVSAVLIGTSTSKGRATKRGLLGVLAFGTVGALAAAVGEDDLATFSVKYKSGRTGTETVKIGSLRYRQLSAVLVE